MIDLPIAREKATWLPFLPGSSVKGALRTRAFLEANENENLKTLYTCIFGPENNENENLKTLYTCIFGPENNDGPDARASMVQFSDQKLLLLPVRSLAGTFAWITSPYILRRLARDINDISPTRQDSLPTIPVVDKEACLVANKDNNSDAAIVMAIKSTGKKKVYLEDLELNVQADSIARKWAKWIGKYVFPNDQKNQNGDGKGKDANDDGWQGILDDRFCVVHDDVFNFLITTATEVTARIRLQENSKTVVDGGLWYEEALPTETILSGIVMATPHKDENGHTIQVQGHDLTTERIFRALKGLSNTSIQLGGEATVGRGLCRVLLVDNDQNHEERK